MARIFTALVLIFTIQLVHAEIIVVSDLDETIKQYGDTTKWGKVKKALYSNKVYRGVPQLLQTFDRITSRQYVLSGSPSIIRKSIWRLLNYHNIPVEGLITNRWAPFKDTYPYKYSRLTGLFNYYTEAKFILIGDNTSKDAQVYKDMEKKYPGRVLAIYIHKVDEKADDEGVTNYYSAYEVAYHEYKAGRMSYEDVEQLYLYIFEADKMSELFVKGGDCPTDQSWFSHLNDQSLWHLTKLMTEKIVDYCIDYRS